MLISEIIDLLGRDDANLTQILLKTKILLYEIEKKELAQWVNAELTGYSEGDDVPGYRKVKAQVLGNVASIAWRYSNHPLPTMHLSESEPPASDARVRPRLRVDADPGEATLISRFALGGTVAVAYRNDP